MNILISSASDCFTDCLPASEGLISYEIVKRLAELGHNFWVISPKIKLRKKLRKNVRLYETGSHDIFSNAPLEVEAGRLRFAFQSLSISRKIIEREKIDIVHHILPSDFGRFFDLAPFFFSQPFVIGPTFLPWDVPKKEFTVSEGRPTCGLLRFLGLPLNAVKRFLFLETVRRCDALLASTRKVGKKYSGLIDKNKIRHLPIGVDTSLFRPASPAKQFTILTAGLLYKRKGFDYLIRAMPLIIGNFPEARLSIAGDGINRKYFEGVVAELGLGDKVAFLGYQSRRQMVRHYQNCSLFCLPSLYEPFGLVILEAMACGRPVVVTNAGGIPEIVKHGGNGILVPPRNPEALARAITLLLSDRGKMARFGRESRRIAKRYDWEIVVDRIERVYKGLVNKNNRI